MPPPVALTLSLVMMAALLWREPRVRPGVSIATWIPTLWILILSSRSVGQWLELGSPVSAADAYVEGSPVDRLVYLALMIAAFVVVLRRGFAWSDFVSQNLVWVLFFLYCGLSILWSDYPGVSFRRLFKSLGDPLMVFLLLTEAHPARAIEVVLRRVAYILLPLSVVFIKYYPHLGRGFSPWGAMYHTGVTTNKNLLGFLLMVFGLFFLCSLMAKANANTQTAEEKKIRRGDAIIGVVFLFQIQFLFTMADSSTALGAFIAAAVVAITLRFSLIRTHFGKFVVAGLILLVVLQVLFGIHETAIEGLGRETTLTGRTDIWDLVLKLQPNPLLGAGFESFWLGDRLLKMWAAFPVFLPNQAHNGYLEMYLNLGIVGLVLFTGALAASYVSIRQRLTNAAHATQDFVYENTFATFGPGFFVAYILYNVTEATFKPLTLLFIVFMMLTIRYSPQAQTVGARVPNRWGGATKQTPERANGGGPWAPAPETLRTTTPQRVRPVPAQSQPSRDGAVSAGSRWRPKTGDPKTRPSFRESSFRESSFRESSLQSRVAKIRQKAE
jgi:O-antigen ligase